MTTRHPLPLYEELMLIALDDEKGTSFLDSMSVTALGGALLAELVLEGAVRISDDRKKQVTVVPGSGHATGDPILAEALQKIRDAKKPKSAKHWVQKLSSMKDLRHRVARQLVAKGILTETTDKVLFVFTRTIYPETDGGPERALIARLEDAIFSSRQDLDERTVILIALAHATDLLKRVIDKKRLKTRKDRLKQITSGEAVGQATKEAVEAVKAAVMVAVIIPSVVVATS